VDDSVAPMKVSLFIPCLVEDFHPEIGEATARVLDRAGVEVVYEPRQTCCGQLAFKTGHRSDARRFARHFLEVFDGAEAVVAPSGSCVSMVRNYYPLLFEQEPAWAQAAAAVASRTYELSEFLVDVAGVLDLGATWRSTAVYHDSCQVSRALGVREQPLALLRRVAGLTMLPLADTDRCCGFGGVFSLQFPEVSERMLLDKAAAIAASGAEYVISAEVSCLMNIGGYLDKAGAPARAVHLAEVLAGGEGV
jgi:L-lactate dehydrogenase complex protein LldE